MALIDKVASAYLMEETSGDRSDSVGTDDLTDNNTVGYTASGKNGNAADFIAANSESLTAASSSVHDFNGVDFAISVWVYVDVDANSFFVAKGTNNTTNGYVLYWLAASNTIRWEVQGSGTDSTVDFGSLSTGQWYHLLCWWDSSDGYAYARLDGASAQQGGASTSYAGSSNVFSVGRASGAAFYFDGKIDELYIFDSLPTTAEGDDLAAGAYYPFSTDYTLTADAGSYAVSGTAANLEYNRVLGADPGSYGLSGTVANLEYNRIFGVDAGSYALTGSEADLRVTTPTGGLTHGRLDRMRLGSMGLRS